MNKSIAIGIWLVLGPLALLGCADDDQLSSGIATTPSAGLSGGPLAETLNVYAVDADSGKPLSSASVRLGVGTQAYPVGRTGNDGKLTLSELAGAPQFLTVSAPGYAAASWGPITSAVATIPLEAKGVMPATAELVVTIPGWGALPAPSAGKYRVARFAFSKPSGLTALEATADEPLPECRASAAGSPEPCSVTLDIPIDTSTVMAVIAEGNDAGTSKASSDVFTMTGIGIVTHLDLRASAHSSATVALLDGARTARATIVQQGPSAGIFQEVVGVPGITLGQQLLLYPPLGGMSSTFLVPTASGAFADLRLWAVATAGNGTANDWSRSYERGVAAPVDAEHSIVLTTSGFLGVPAVNERAPDRYTLSSGAALNRVEFSAPNGQVLNALLLPPQTEFELPAGVFDAPPAQVAVEAFDWDLDPLSFDFQQLISQTQRIAYAQAP